MYINAHWFQSINNFRTTSSSSIITYLTDMTRWQKQFCGICLAPSIYVKLKMYAFKMRVPAAFYALGLYGKIGSHEFF